MARPRCSAGWWKRSRSAAYPGVGHDTTQRRNAIQQRLPVGRTGRSIPLPAGPCAAQPLACIHAFKQLRTHVTKADIIIYRASQSDCATCPMKARCCPNTPMRKIARSIHESARAVARDIARSDAYKQSRKDRKKVEMLFAYLKRILK